MNFLRQIGAIVMKDLLIEWRSLARSTAVFVFALSLVLLVAFASGGTGTDLRKQAGGALWIGLLLASTRSLDRSFAVEMEQGALEGLVLWPVDPLAVYYGKAIANMLVLVLVGFALTPLVIALFDAPIKGSPVLFAAYIILGSAAIAAPGTIFALITERARGASVMLPVLLLPLVTPAVLAASRGCEVLVEGDPMNQAPAWLGVLATFNVVHWSLSGWLFAKVLEEA
jgi:heme exporter protein B